jgi:hypothetical protein
VTRKDFEVRVAEAPVLSDEAAWLVLLASENVEIGAYIWSLLRRIHAPSGGRCACSTVDSGR